MHPRLYVLRREAKLVNQRLGQYFINNYTAPNIRTDSLSELFLETDDDRAASIIDEWLESHHYHTSLPTKVRL